MPRISRRAPLVVGAALALLVAVPVAADTTGGPTNVDYAVANSPDGSMVQVSHDYLAGESHLAVSTQWVEPVTCADGTTGELDISLNGGGVPSTYSFGKQLSSASASGTIPALQDVYNSCTSEQTEDAVSMTVTISLTGSKYTSTTNIRTVTKNPDGTTTTYAGKFTSVTATGTFSINGVTTTASDAQIAHDEMTVKTK